MRRDVNVAVVNQATARAAPWYRMHSWLKGSVASPTSRKRAERSDTDYPLLDKSSSDRSEGRRREARPTMRKNGSASATRANYGVSIRAVNGTRLAE